VDNSQAHCPALAPVGGLERHTCASGKSFWCSGGTAGCADNSPEFCKAACQNGAIGMCVQDRWVTVLP
jgi:hypothetical protein